MRRPIAGLALSAMLLGAMAPAAASQIVTEGNRRLDDDAIRSFFPATSGQPLTDADLDAALKAMYRSNQFSDVHLTRNGATVRVKVSENPLIGRVAFDGNRKLADKDLQSFGEEPPERPVVARAGAR